MNPSLAAFACVTGICGLFYLNRDSSLSTSKALWISVIWLLLTGSRPVSFWLGSASQPLTVEAIDDGSPLDAAVLLSLMVCGAGVLVGRARKVRSLMRANWPLILYFSYGLVS